MHECDFCYNTPQFVFVFSKGREIHTCNEVGCIAQIKDIALEEKDFQIHSIENYER